MECVAHLEGMALAPKIRPTFGRRGHISSIASQRSSYAIVQGQTHWTLSGVSPQPILPVALAVDHLRRLARRSPTSASPVRTSEAPAS